MENFIAETREAGGIYPPFPMHVNARTKKMTEFPRMPRILPFLVQRYNAKGNPTPKVHQPSSRSMLILRSVIVKAFEQIDFSTDDLNRLNNKERGIIQAQRRSFFYADAPYTTTASSIWREDFATAMVIPFMSDLEAIIGFSNEMSRAICTLTIEDIILWQKWTRPERFSARDKKSKTKALEYAKIKISTLATAMINLPSRN